MQFPQSSTYQLIPNFYGFRAWKDFPITCGFTERTVDFSFSAPHEQKDIFLRKLGISLNEIVFLNQVHSSRCAVLNKKPDINPIPKTDAIITAQKKRPIAVLTADCVPIFIYIKNTTYIGIIHAGWRGIHNGIIEHVFNALFDEFDISANNIQVAIGPCIRECCFEVKDDVALLFPNACTVREGVSFVDLVRAIRDRLHAYGIDEHTISDSNICTSCLNDRFFSYRKEQEKAGRILSVIMVHS